MPLLGADELLLDETLDELEDAGALDEENCFEPPDPPPQPAIASSAIAASRRWATRVSEKIIMGNTFYIDWMKGQLTAGLVISILVYQYNKLCCNGLDIFSLQGNFPRDATTGGRENTDSGGGFGYRG